MRILLDTHSWLWFYLGDSRLSARARFLIEDTANQKFVSPVSYWELAIKVSLGKYVLMESYNDLMQHAIFDNGFGILPIEIHHATRVASLDYHAGHRDPFDRLLIAQALVERVPVVGGDAKFDNYGVVRLW